MPKLLPMLALLGLAACGDPYPNYTGNCALYAPSNNPIMNAYNDACLAREAEENARAAGGVVTRCQPDGRGGTVCTTS
jgi:hypothetical protein